MLIKCIHVTVSITQPYPTISDPPPPFNTHTNYSENPIFELFTKESIVQVYQLKLYHHTMFAHTQRHIKWYAITLPLVIHNLNRFLSMSTPEVVTAKSDCVGTEWRD